MGARTPPGGVARRHNRKSTVMYCVRVRLTLLGPKDPKEEWYYLRFRPHGMARGYSPWTEDIREAKFWLYQDRPYHWLNIENRGVFNGEVLCLQRDDEVLKAQRDMR